MATTSDRIRTVVVDDEPLAREGMRILLEQDPDIDVVGEAGDGASALKAIRTLKPDLLFLDVQMPAMNGLQVLDRLQPAEMPVVVFATAYDQYAIQAFERSAIDYLLKPLDDERFDKALGRAKTQIRQRKAGELNRKLIALLDGFRSGGSGTAEGLDAVAGGENGPWLTRLAIKSSGKIVFLRVEEIDWIGAADYYVELHVSGKAHLLREAMAKLETKLDPKRFLRIHRSAIVNVERVEEIRSSPHGDCTVILRDGTKLKLSRSRRDKLRTMVKGAS